MLYLCKNSIYIYENIGIPFYKMFLWEVKKNKL